MAGRRRAPRRPRGGEGVQAPGTRLTTAAGALAALGAVDAIALAAGGRLAPLEVAAAAASLGLLATGLALRRSGTVPWAIALAAAGYLAGRAGHAVVDGRAAAVGVLLLLAAELASWATDEHPRIRPEPEVVTRRLALLGALALVSLVVDVLVLAASGLEAGGGTAPALVGTVAAVGAVAVALRLVRR